MVQFTRCLFALSFVVTKAVTPVEKVTSLLTQLSNKVAEEGKNEAVEYDRFACFCKDQSDNKQYAIEKSDEKIASLTAELESLDADIADLSGEVAELGTRITEIEGEHSAEVKSSATAQAAYEKDALEMADAIKSAEGAIVQLKASKDQLKDAKLDFRQLQARGFLTAKLGAAVAAAKQKPAAYAYNSNEIIAVIQDLLATFKKTKMELWEAEKERSSASESKLLGLSNEKKFKSATKAEKEELIGTKTEAKHEAEKDKTAETDARDADEKFRDELATQCEDRAKEFDGRSKSRAAELTAMADAIRVLKSGVAPKYSANKKLVGLSTRVVVKMHVPSPANASANRSSLRGSAPVAFLQVGRKDSDVKRSLLEHLDAEAKKLGSPVLAAVALKLSLRDTSGEDHFVKVRGIINDLVAKLEAQALAEADSKSFCDKEMTAAMSSRDEQQLSVEEQTTIISLKETEVAKMTQEIATLSKEVADLQKALNEATELRSEEKANNAKTIADAGEGKAAVEQAISLLKAYYDAQGGFIQQPIVDREDKTIDDLAPKMSYEGEYKGAQDSATGVIGILQVILSDFERTEKTVAEEETAAQTAYEKYETDTKTDIDAKETEKTEKETGITERKEAITTAKGALNDAKTLHETALSELDNLKASCVDGAESWEERKAQREKEIEALKGAMTILENWK